MRLTCSDATFGVRCELEPGHEEKRHRNGLLVWWNPPLLVLGGLEEVAAVGESAVSGSALSVVREPERAAASSSTRTQMTVLPGTTFEDIFA